jgi:hypothetical protein
MALRDKSRGSLTHSALELMLRWYAHAHGRGDSSYIRHASNPSHVSLACLIYSIHSMLNDRMPDRRPCQAQDSIGSVATKSEKAKRVHVGHVVLAFLRFSMKLIYKLDLTCDSLSWSEGIFISGKSHS